MISHSSAFQTISVKSVYRKIIKCSGSILVNLNKIKKTNRHATRKDTNSKGTIFVVEGFLPEQVQNLHFFINSISWNYVQYIFISGGAPFFLCAINVRERIQIMF